MISKIVKELISNNQKFIKNDLAQIYNPFIEKQTPKITLVTCSDSRISATGLFAPNTINHVFSIRNIGNQIRSAEGSVDFGVLKLRTPVLVILGHTCCSAVRMSLTDFSGDTLGICRELSLLKEGLQTMEKRYKTDEDPIAYERYTEINVDYQVKYAVQRYRELVNSGELTVIGMMVDLNRSFHGATCEEYITNINGTSDINQIKQMDALSEIDNSLIEEVVKTIV
ncbi:MAG: carbonic anhydrase [Desulforegulaceae bacterium]|nr:carbonic anhydrase [Desulforegulaceae bacterium]